MFVPARINLAISIRDCCNVQTAAARLWQRSEKQKAIPTELNMCATDIIGTVRSTAHHTEFGKKRLIK